MMGSAQHQRPDGKGNHGGHRGRDGGIPLEPAAHNPGRRRAAGIYGTIIIAAILDTAGGRLSTEALVTAVVVTLLVHWIAEQYAEVLGEQATGGRLPGWA